MIQKNKILFGHFQSQPYPYSLIENFIEPTDFQLLLENFPQEGFLLTTRIEGSDKTYAVDNNVIFQLETQQKNPLILEYLYWSKLIDELTSNAYKQAVSELFGIDLEGAPMELTLKRYKKSHYISPHTDRDFVKATHLIFFNKIWEKGWGGELCIMSSSEKVEKEILPLQDQSLIFLRTDDSWHSVKECHAPVPRIVLQITFWKNRERCLPEGREEVPY